MICSNCHHEMSAQDAISPYYLRPCTTCPTCRAAVAKTRQRRNEGRVRRYEVKYFRRDPAGLACLDCPLSRCVYETGESLELCPIG